LLLAVAAAVGKGHKVVLTAALATATVTLVTAAAAVAASTAVAAVLVAVVVWQSFTNGRQSVHGPQRQPPPPGQRLRRIKMVARTLARMVRMVKVMVVVIMMMVMARRVMATTMARPQPTYRLVVRMEKTAVSRGAKEKRFTKKGTITTKKKKGRGWRGEGAGREQMVVALQLFLAARGSASV
jgi:hypothetical protein